MLVATMRAIRLDRPIVLASVGRAIEELAQHEGAKSSGGAKMLLILRVSWPQLATDGVARRHFIHAARAVLAQEELPNRVASNGDDACSTSSPLVGSDERVASELP